MAVMSFQASLPSEFDTSKSHILSSLEISLLAETFSWFLRIETPHLFRLVMHWSVKIVTMSLNNLRVVARGIEPQGSGMLLLS